MDSLIIILSGILRGIAMGEKSVRTGERISWASFEDPNNHALINGGIVGVVKGASELGGQTLALILVGMSLGPRDLLWFTF